MNTPSKCPKCGEEMGEGFILDHWLPSRWFAGKPEASAFGKTKVHGREQHLIESYRCVACGYLELYARA